MTERAINALGQGLEQNPTSERLRVWQAASYAQAGRIDDAKWEMDRVRLANSDVSTQRIRGAFPCADAADLDRFLRGLQLAGLTE